MAVGMAIAEKHLAAVYNRPGYEVVDHHTYAMLGDGDLMEGVSHEAASLAGTLGLGKLIFRLRRQPDLIGWADEPELHRGCAKALRGLPLARAASGGRKRSGGAGDGD